MLVDGTMAIHDPHPGAISQTPDSSRRLTVREKRVQPRVGSWIPSGTFGTSVSGGPPCGTGGGADGPPEGVSVPGSLGGVGLLDGMPEGLLPGGTRSWVRGRTTERRTLLGEEDVLVREVIARERVVVVGVRRGGWAETGPPLTSGRFCSESQRS